MRLQLFVTFIFLFLHFVIYGNGVRIKGNQFSIDERSSVSLYGNKLSLSSSKVLNLNFQLSYLSEKAHGTIVQLKFIDSKDIYSLSYRELNNDSFEFIFNIEGRQRLGAIIMSRDILKLNKWIDVKIAFDFKRSKVVFAIGQHQSSSNLPLSISQNQALSLITFGKNDYTIDIADVAIKNIEITNDISICTIPLKERSGEAIHDISGQIVGKNHLGEWLINEAYYWKKWKKIHLDKPSGYQFNVLEGKFYVFTRSSIQIIDTYTGNQKIHYFENPLPVEIQLGNSFIHKDNLFVYEVNNLSNGGCSMVKIDLNNLSYDCTTNQQFEMQLHHHTGALLRDQYYIFGGFGNDKYSNKFLEYNLIKNVWDTISIVGDKIIPRYFSSSVLDSSKQLLYLFGGMGNPAGDHTIGRNYYYDLYELNLNTNKLVKTKVVDWQGVNKVPVRNLVRLDGSFYTLMYSEYISDSYLQLYKFDGSTPIIEPLADSIPIRSDKIRTNANIFYSSHLQQFYAVTNVFDKEEQTSILSIYSLRAPAISKAAFDTGNNDWKSIYYAIFIIILLISIYFVWYFREKLFYRKNSNVLHPTISPTKLKLQLSSKPSFEFPQKNSIYLFGLFEALDKRGDNITHLFNGKVKQLFLLFFTKNLEEGISAEYISLSLWPDKDFLKSKNVRGVTINHLRKNLEYLEGIKLIFAHNKYRLVIEDHIYVDYIKFQSLIKSDFENYELLSIIKRGPFLLSLDDEFYDDIKSKIENLVVEYLNQMCDYHYNAANYEDCVYYSRILLNVDPLNQQALRFEINSLCRSNHTLEARKRFNKFQKRYEEYMGSPSGLIFEAVLNK